MDDDERRRWLFPLATGTFDDVQLALLDPADEGDRALLIRAEHPELVDAIDQGVEEITLGEHRGPMSPRLHLTVHEVVANQLWEGQPPEGWPSVERLIAAGYDRHDILHMLGSVLTEEVFAVQNEGKAVDPERYAAALDALPGAWWDHDLDDDDSWEDSEIEPEQAIYAALDSLAAFGPQQPHELSRRLDFDAAEMAFVQSAPAIVALADERLASVTAVVEDTTFTHRLTEEEATSRELPLGPDLAPIQALVCDGDHVHLASGEIAEISGDLYLDDSSDARLVGPDGWLGAARAGDLIGFRVLRMGKPIAESGLDPAVATLEITFNPQVDQNDPDTLPAQLRATFGRFGDGMPITPLELVCQLSVDAPALTEGVMAPISELLEQGRFEVVAGHTAPAGTDWEAFWRLRDVVRTAASHGLTLEEGRGLAMICEMGHLTAVGKLDRIDRQVAHEILSFFAFPALAEAFAATTADDREAATDFLTRLREAEGPKGAAQLAWVEALVAQRHGDPTGAEAFLRQALAADPGHQLALADSAWYASDRGDPQGALRFLERLDDEPLDDRADLIRRYAQPPGAAPVGRNSPCPCGSGRKYKHCCLGARPTAVSHPLPARVHWMWEKLRWWLDRSGREQDAVIDLAIELHGGPPSDGDSLPFLIDLDIAASLVLFVDGEIGEFLAERGPLLPDDERNLITQWALTDSSVHEVVGLRRGEGMSLRDLRTGEVVDVREAKGSTQLAQGDLLFAHPVFDGVGYQFVGGVRPLPLSLRDSMLALLDEAPTGLEVAVLLGRCNQPPELRNMEGEETLLCEATYRVESPEDAARCLDSVLEPGGDGSWMQWTEVDGQRWLRASARLDGDQLSVSANSGARFDRVRDLVEAGVPRIELLREERTPVSALTRGKRPAGPPVSAEIPAEASAAIAGFIRQKETEWLDEHVPALAGLTPRQAADDPTRREDLVALLHDFDRMPTPPGGIGFDTARLRRALGIAARE